ncbi:MAG: hypothetical protein SFV54_04485 [Bryobacteraceae bacterium]|nr:hypothetical protein [Bryobacteraceae bacterium]
MRTYILMAATCLLGFSASAAEMTGWISDSNCGRSNAKADASARECTERCIKGGAAAVFVDEKDQKVYKLAGKADATKHIKYKVKVSGKVQGDTLTVDSIGKAD